jgi:hypothetical protein
MVASRNTDELTDELSSVP